MIVPSMTTEELTNEIMKDYEIVLRKAFYSTVSLRREAIKSKDKHVKRIFDYNSKNNNRWFIIVDYYKKEPTFVVVVYYVDAHGLNGVMINSDQITLTHFTPHFLCRYNERYLKDKTLSKIELLRRFISENALSCTMDAPEKRIFGRFREGIGLGFRENINGYTLFHYKTYISKQMIHDDQQTDFVKSGRIIEKYWNDMYQHTKKSAFEIV